MRKDMGERLGIKGENPANKQVIRNSPDLWTPADTKKYGIDFRQQPCL